MWGAVIKLKCHSTAVRETQLPLESVPILFIFGPKALRGKHNKAVFRTASYIIDKNTEDCNIGYLKNNEKN